MKLFQDEKFATLVLAKIVDRLIMYAPENIKLILLLEHEYGKDALTEQSLNSIADSTIVALLDNEIPF
ncbi:hypothetical protein [Ferruginibacter sp. HRS2-29]|uniref:hypothetical protein n=1 Tax=Ferruginibacter sp. HRS2-29 TaxID=2487334 RepID=UPI0020CF2C36|nr:hypothetical protein [Ferruginibacter sp. HRS2-29]MCP9750175.1 hypothetical protein [Ferruginibacter sp. HRS2-29]